MTIKHDIHVMLQKVTDNLEALAMPERVVYVSAAARDAARESAKLAGLELRDFPKSDKGVPLPSGKIYWSLTHKPLYVGGVAGLSPVGVDLEQFRPIAMKIYDKVANAQEWQQAINAGLDSRTAFFMFWTAKEALLKRLGLGLSKGLAACRVEEVASDELAVLSYDKTRYQVYFRKFNDHLAAVCADNFKQIVWHLRD